MVLGEAAEHPGQGGEVHAGAVDPAGRLPPTPWLELDQAVTLPAGPDVAVVAPGLDVEAGEDAVQVAVVVRGTPPAEARRRAVTGPA